MVQICLVALWRQITRPQSIPSALWWQITAPCPCGGRSIPSPRLAPAPRAPGAAAALAGRGRAAGRGWGGCLWGGRGRVGVGGGETDGPLKGVGGPLKGVGGRQTAKSRRASEGGEEGGLARACGKPTGHGRPARAGTLDPVTRAGTGDGPWSSAGLGRESRCAVSGLRHSARRHTAHRDRHWPCHSPRL